MKWILKIIILLYSLLSLSLLVLLHVPTNIFFYYWINEWKKRTTSKQLVHNFIKSPNLQWHFVPPMHDYAGFQSLVAEPCYDAPILLTSSCSLSTIRYPMHCFPFLCFFLLTLSCLAAWRKKKLVCVYTSWTKIVHSVILNYGHSNDHDAFCISALLWNVCWRGEGIKWSLQFFVISRINCGQRYSMDRHRRRRFWV